MIRVLSIIGATASGKSDLALEYAEKFNGEIVSCDSVQIYKYFNIGSAKPSLEEMNRVPHHLIDCLEPTMLCNAGYWKDQAITIITDIHQRGKIPIIVGGTGLYLKALYLGMFEEESRNQEYRELLQQKATQQGILTLFNELTLKDPVYASKINSNDSLRIIRALEAIHVTQQPFSSLHHRNIKPPWQWVFTQPFMDRETIYSRIEKRVYQMIEKGLIEEVGKLLLKYGSEVSPMKAIGYKHVVQYLSNELTLVELKQNLIQDTRRFAKRQLSLFRSLVLSSELVDPQMILSKGIFL